MTLALGDKGPAVRALQQALVTRSLLPGAGAVDGDFGPQTEAAVKALQGAAGLAQSGIADDATLAALSPAPMSTPRQAPPTQAPPTQAPPTQAPPRTGVLLGAGAAAILYSLWPQEKRTSR